MRIDSACETCSGLGYLMFPAANFNYYAERYMCEHCFGVGIQESEVDLDPNDLIKEMCNENK